MRPVILAVVAAAAFTTALVVGAQGPPPTQGGRAGGAGRGGDPPPPASGTGIIVGTVVDAATGRPVPGAIVALGGRGGQPQPTVLVGPDGRFVFRDLPAGSFPLPVTKNGYLDSGAGRTSPAGPMRPVALRDGDRIGDVVLRLWRQSVISGTVSDERGEPGVAVKVTLLQRAIVDGRLGLLERDSTVSDDRGAWRFAKVAPGRYVVAVQQDLESFAQSAMVAMAADLPAIMNVVAGAMAGGTQIPDVELRARIIPSVFAPGVTTAGEAATITVESGDERSGVAVRAARVSTYRIAGTIGGPDPMPSNLSVQLTAPAQSGRPVGMNLQGGRGGRFDFLAVPPGQYELQVVVVPRMGGAGRGGGRGAPPPPVSDDPTWWALQRITIADKDETDLAIVLRPGVRITGRVQFEGTSPPPAPERLSVFAASADGGLGSRTNMPAGVGTDGSFRSVGLPPGRYTMGLSGTISPWRLKAVRAGGRDMTGVPFDVEGDEIADVVIALTDQPFSTISGSVREARNDGAVFAFPVDRQLWGHLGGTALRFKSVRITEGRYSVSGLPEGEYYIFAGPEDRIADWLQPEVLEQFASLAARIQIREAEQRTLDLTRGSR